MADLLWVQSLLEGVRTSARQIPLERLADDSRIFQIDADDDAPVEPEQRGHWSILAFKGVHNTGPPKGPTRGSGDLGGPKIALYPVDHLMEFEGAGEEYHDRQVQLVHGETAAVLEVADDYNIPAARGRWQLVAFHGEVPPFNTSPPVITGTLLEQLGEAVKAAGFTEVGRRSETVPVGLTTAEVEYSGMDADGRRHTAVVRLWVGYETTPGSQQRLMEAASLMVAAVKDHTNALFTGVTTDVVVHPVTRKEFQVAEIAVREA